MSKILLLFRKLDVCREYLDGLSVLIMAYLKGKILEFNLPVDTVFLTMNSWFEESVCHISQTILDSVTCNSSTATLSAFNSFGHSSSSANNKKKKIKLLSFVYCL